VTIDNSTNQHRAATRATTAVIVAILLVAGLASSVASQGFRGAGGIEGNANAAYAIGLWGDLPYSAVQETVGLPNLIADT
jgi:hypothetical protein